MDGARSSANTRAPLAASAFAVAPPRPDAPPVTSAAVSVICICAVPFVACCSDSGPRLTLVRTRDSCLRSPLPGATVPVSAVVTSGCHLQHHDVSSDRGGGDRLRRLDHGGLPRGARPFRHLRGRRPR